jgi:dTDP-4-dehydrorhamnose reductase
MRHILQFGASGQVGSALVRAAPGHGLALTALDRSSVNLADPEAAASAVRAAPQLDGVIIAAAYTAVDRAESEPELAEAVNHLSVVAIGKAAAARGASVIHISTDYVFDGHGGAPYIETAQTNPLNVYGATKLRGEQALLAACPSAVILRTSWVYAPGFANFVSTMQRLGRERTELRVVSDQFGCPTHAHDLAKAIASIAQQISTDPGPHGVFHYSGAGECSWADFARAIFALDPTATNRPDVISIPSSEYATPAERPRDTRMDCGLFDRTFGFKRPFWKDRLAETLACLSHAATPQ